MSHQNCTCSVNSIIIQTVKRIVYFSPFQLLFTEDISPTEPRTYKNSYCWQPSSSWSFTRQFAVKTTECNAKSLDSTQRVVEVHCENVFRHSAELHYDVINCQNTAATSHCDGRETVECKQLCSVNYTNIDTFTNWQYDGTKNVSRNDQRISPSNFSAILIIVQSRRDTKQHLISAFPLQNAKTS